MMMVMNPRDKSIDQLQLTVRSYNCLTNARIHTLGELSAKTEAELLQSKHFGRKSLTELKEILTGFGLHFGMGTDDDDDSISVRHPANPRHPASGARRLQRD
jgi:DNA-directed RNA polymerase subunit alpha